NPGPGGATWSPWSRSCRPAGRRDPMREGATAMDIEMEAGEHAAVVAIAGSVDGLTADTLLTTLQGYVEAGHTRLVADLERVDYTSSAGLRALLATVKQARQRGGDLRLA